MFPFTFWRFTKALCLTAVVLVFAAQEKLIAQSLQFNGTNQYVSFGPATAGLGASQFTIECWFYRTGAGATSSTGSGGVTANALVTKGQSENDNSTVDCNYYLGINPAGNLVADYEEGTGQLTPGLNHPVTGATQLANNTWYHAAATFDGTTMRIYVNGVLDGTTVVGPGRLPQVNSIQHAAIGASINSTGVAAGFFAGRIDDARVWNVARTATQIASRMNTDNLIGVPDSANLKGYYRMNAGLGTVLNADKSPGVNSVTAGTFPTWLTAGSPFNAPTPNLVPVVSAAIAPQDATAIYTNTPTLSISASDNENAPLTVTFFGRKREQTGTPFTIIPLPDTQFYSQNSGGTAGSVSTFYNQTSWVVANKDSLNIKYLIQLGDCVQNGDNNGNPIEWTRADTAFKIIENPVTTNLSHGIPYGICVGNHDQGPTGSGGASLTTTFYNQFFGENRFLGRPYYGGHHSTTNDNHFQTFTADGMDFISISFEYDPLADVNVLNWADSLLAAYPNHRGIVSSHWIINADGSFGAQGQAIYNKLKARPNLDFMLCGHINPNGEARRTDVFNGNTTHTILSDFQNRPNGGDGWLRQMKFDKAQNKVSVKTYSTTQNIFETDANSQFELDYDMGGAYTNYGSTVIASGGTATFPWASLEDNEQYDWYATVSDGTNTVTTSVNDFYVNPTPEIIAPNGGEIFANGFNSTVTFKNKFIANCKLEYTNDEGTNWTEITAAATNGSYAWLVNAPAAGANYKIRVSDPLAATFKADTSAGPFSIIVPTPIIQLLAPNGGEVFSAGQAVNVTWNSTYVNQVNLDYSSDNGINWKNITSNLEATPSTFRWFTPDSAQSNTYLVRVSNAINVAIFDASNANFKVGNDTLVKFGSVWAYRDSGTAVVATWKDASFNFSTWKKGPSELGYGDGPEATILSFGSNSSAKYPANYFLRRIFIPDASKYAIYRMGVVRDDGAIVYVNGTEVWRNGMPAGAVTHLTFANQTIDAAGESTPTVVNVAGSNFVNGWNTIATQVHQANGTSSDISFNLQIVGDTNAFTVMAPNGGQIFYPGAVTNITWSNNANFAGNVQIELSIDNGATYTVLTNSVLASAQTYAWTVPATAAENCLIKVSNAANLARFDVSNAVFVIKATPTPFNPCVTPDHIGCFVSVQPQAQVANLRYPLATHDFQRLIKTGDALTLGGTFGTAPDFTNFVPRILSLNPPTYSSTQGDLAVNQEADPGAVNILHISLDTTKQLWNIDSSGNVAIPAADLVKTVRNCSGGLTPWNTTVTAEENTGGGDANNDGYQDVGWLMEIDPITRQVRDYNNDGTKDKLWAMGRMSHENVVFMQDSLTAYYGEDGNTQCVYKFIANQKMRFDAGTLYVLRRTGSTGIWIQVPNTTQAERNTTFTQAGALGGTNFSGVEDVEYNKFNGLHYFSSKGNAIIYRFKDNGATVSQFEEFVGNAAISYAINYGTGTANEAWGTGIDNLVFDDLGNLWAQQDGGRNHIWVIRPDHTPLNPKVALFATTPAGSESTGLTFTPDFKYGFYSFQHPTASNSIPTVDAKGTSVVFNTGTTITFSNKNFLGCNIGRDTVTVANCGPYTWPFNGEVYSSTGNFIDTLVKADGCDSIVLLKLNITPITKGTTTADVCGSYIWAVNGITYTMSKIDSVVTGCDTKYLHLTVTPFTADTTVVSACGTYTWAENNAIYSNSGLFFVVDNCDTQFLDLIIVPINRDTTAITACDTYTWPLSGAVYTTSGLYKVGTGCDTSYLKLTINLGTLFYADTDADGFYGAGAATVSLCTSIPPAGYVLVSRSGDCDPTNPTIFPGAYEVCGSATDINCDGIVGSSITNPILVSQTVVGNTATLVWSASCAFRYRIQVQQVGKTSWQYYYTKNLNTLEVSGLESGKSCRWSVRGQANSLSPYTNPMAAPNLFQIP